MNLALISRISECFVQQKHRRFVFGVLLDLEEDCVTLYLFDRSGTVSSQPLPIHDTTSTSYAAAARFVRIILLVSSQDPAIVGIDPAWFCRGTSKYVQIKDVVYKHIEDIHFSDSLFGHASASYLVEGPISESTGSERRRFVVKEAWREEDRPAEYDILREVEKHHVEGVAKVVDCDDEDEFNTRSLRPTLVRVSPEQGPSTGGDGEPTELADGYRGRIQTRFVQEFYGIRTIDQWKDPVILLKALLDIVKGGFPPFILMFLQ